MSSQLATINLYNIYFYNIIVIKPNLVETNRLIYIIRPNIYIYLYDVSVEGLLTYSGLVMTLTLPLTNLHGHHM